MGSLGRLRQLLGLRKVDPRRAVGRLELHVTHVCNLACESCSHYSNHLHRGNLDLAEADAWMAAWDRRLAPRTFHLLGGEPTIHPELPEFVRMVRRHWPGTFIEIRTNGFFLHRHPELPAMMAADKRFEVALAVHHDSAEYLEHLQPTFALVKEWERAHGIRIKIHPSFANWTQRYTGFGATMEPFADGNPRQSWEICPARDCKQLFEGKVWKCAPLAYLKLQKEKYPLSAKWDPYLKYKPLSPDCSDAELDEFIGRRDEASCAMCAAVARPLALPIPLRRARPRQVAALAG